MPISKIKSGVLAFLFFAATHAGAADFFSRDEAELGYTNNAYLTDANSKADEYWRISSANTWTPPAHRLILRLSYRDYFHEKPNDIFSWRLADKWRLPWDDWNGQAWVYGNHYTTKSPGVTDESFSNLGAGGKAERSQRINSRSELTWGPSYDLRRYMGAGARTEHTVAGNLEFDYEASPVMNFDASTVFAVLLSDSSNYSRMYVEISGDADYDFGSGWKLNANATLRESVFMNRTVSTTTVVTKARGRAVATTANVKETYSGIGLLTEIERTLNERWRAGFQVGYDQQSSQSGLQNYSALNTYARLTWVF